MTDILPAGVNLDESTVFAVPEPYSSEMLSAPKIFQEITHVSFSLTILGFILKLSTTGSIYMYFFTIITVAMAVTAPFALDAVILYSVDVAGATCWLPIGSTLPTLGLMEIEVALDTSHFK